MLISGAPGTAKTTLGAIFAESACQRGETVAFISFDEGSERIAANMRSIGTELNPYIQSGQLQILSLRADNDSPEAHYMTIRQLILEKAPRFLILDPISALLGKGYPFGEQICDDLLVFAKTCGITLLCTSLLENAAHQEESTASRISTMADTWIHLAYLAQGGERNRTLTIVKSRSTGHSNQVRELVLTDQGVQLVEVYSAEGEVLLGSARAQKKMQDQQMQTAKRLQHQQQLSKLDNNEAELAVRLEILQRELDETRKQRQWLVEQEAGRVEYEHWAEREQRRLRQLEDEGDS